MKKSKILLTLALGSTLAFTGLVATACNPFTDIRIGGKPQSQTEPKVTTILNFVAVSGTEWDTSVTIDSKTYNVAFTVSSDNTLVLTGTCTGVKEQGGGQGGGGFGFAKEVTFDENGNVADKVIVAYDEEAATDYSKYNFEVTGKWTEEKGYGYTFTMDDAKKSVIHVDYDVTSGRQYFYFAINAKVDGKDVTGDQAKFEAKDPTYKKTLAADYAIYEERVSTYVFHGGNDSGSNLQTATLYFMNDGTAATYTGTSNSMTYTAGGTWTEDKVNHVLTLNIGGSTYTSNGYCDTKGKEGYRISYSSMTCYASCDPASFTWDKYTTEDFEGQIVSTWAGVGDFAEYSLELSAKGYANVKQDGATVYSTRYTEAADGTITIGENSSTIVEGKVTIHVKWVVVTSNCCGTTETPYEGDFQKLLK